MTLNLNGHYVPPEMLGGTGVLGWWGGRGVAGDVSLGCLPGSPESRGSLLCKFSSLTIPGGFGTRMNHCQSLMQALGTASCHLSEGDKGMWGICRSWVGIGQWGGVVIQPWFASTELSCEYEDG